MRRAKCDEGGLSRNRWVRGRAGKGRMQTAGLINLVETLIGTAEQDGRCVFGQTGGRDVIEEGRFAKCEKGSLSVECRGRVRVGEGRM